MRVCVFVCFVGSPLCMRVRNVDGCLCVFVVCVCCRDHVCEYVRAVASVDGSARGLVLVLCWEWEGGCV